MIKRIIRLLVMGIVVSTSLLSLTATRVHTATAQAAGVDPKTQACQALGAASGTTCGTGGTTPDVNSTLKLGINIFSMIVGFAAIIMIIVGGLKYIISNGDSGNINSAKNTILYAIIGLVVVALAQVVVRFVLERVK